MLTTPLYRLFLSAVYLFLIVHPGAALPSGHNQPSAQDNLPELWDILADNFENVNLDKWQLTSPSKPSVSPGNGYNGSTGLTVEVNSNPNYIYRSDIAQADEGYLTFWFNPNGVSIPDRDTTWVPGKSLVIAQVVNNLDGWPPIVTLYLRRPAGQGYQAYLSWPVNAAGERYFDDANGFAVSEGWQKITIGYRINEWVSVWRNGEQKRNATNVVHTNPNGNIALLGKINTAENSPSGTMLFDEVAFQIPRLTHLWVDANVGADTNDGGSPQTAFRSIQRAADQAGPGTTVHILPGVYRESVTPALDGTANERIRYTAENGEGTVFIRGSEASASLDWTPLSANTIGLPPGVNYSNIYSADLSSWNLSGPPRFVTKLENSNNVTNRLPMAREPDWNDSTDWKVHEFWWAADGGSSQETCNPATDPNGNCDQDTRSPTQLTDATNDVSPSGIEAGNLKTVGNLTGATLVAIDSVEGTFVYRRTITSHQVDAGRITVDRNSELGSGSGIPGLGWGTKYYVEGLPNLLDSPGEWWYDANSKRLYLWPLDAGNPGSMNIEISRRDYGFSLRNRSYISLIDLTIDLFNGSAVSQINRVADKSYGNMLHNLAVRYANYGVNIEQTVSSSSPPGNIIDGFIIEESEISNIDSQGIRLLDWWEDNANPNLFTHSGVQNTTIRNNDFHHLGFRSDGDGVGLWFTFANKLRFEGNHVSNVAHNGVQFSRSVIQSAKEYGFDAGEIRTGDILIKDNTFEKACLLTSDCGGLKIYGTGPDTHVFRNLLIFGNVFRNTYGWSYIAQQRRKWTGGENSVVRGLGGFGLYIDHASGIHAYRNIAYNNAYAGYLFYGRWRDGDIIFANNVAANSLYGMSLGGEQYDTHGSTNTQLVNNILAGNEGFGLDLRYAEGRTANMIIDYNLYFSNGWRTYEQGGLKNAGAVLVREGSSSSYNPYRMVSEVKENTPWEDHGVEGDPAFWSYDPADHELHDGSWPDFHLTSASTAAVDHGTVALPASLTVLTNANSLNDYRLGPAYDIGRYEAGFMLLAEPKTQSVKPGGTAYYRLRVFPSDIPYQVTLSAVSPSSRLALSFSPTTISGSNVSTLTVTNDYSGEIIPGILHNLRVTGKGSGFTSTVDISLLLGGIQVYLPQIRR